MKTEFDRIFGDWLDARMSKREVFQWLIRYHMNAANAQGRGNRARRRMLQLPSTRAIIAKYIVKS